MIGIPQHGSVQQAPRYRTLDAIRGIAALLVVVHHLGPYNLGMTFGSEAVMFFFVISGYCITAASEAGLRRGMHFREFMWRRFRRIYPPYLFSVLFYAVTRLIKNHRSGINDFDRHNPIDWVMNLTLTQWLGLLRHPKPAADHNPVLFVAAYWSLNYEEQFYLLMALVMIGSSLLGIKMWRILMVSSIAGIAWNIAFPNVCYGIFLDYWAFFCIGSFAYYRLCLFPASACRILDVLMVGAVLLVTVVWPLVDRSAFSLRAPYEFAIVLSFAALLILLRPADNLISTSRIFPVFEFLGMISYSLYLIHQFNLTLVATVVQKLVPAGSPAMLLTLLSVLFHLALATVFWVFFERPFLNKPLVRPKAAAVIEDLSTQAAI